MEQLNAKYVHSDLHLGNIVTDGKIPRIIDFATLQSIDKLAAVEQKSMDKCITVNKTCVGLPERLRLLAEDEAKSRDVQALWGELYLLLDSAWVKHAFPNKYSNWLTKYEDLGRNMNFCPEYALSIMNVPP